MPAIETHALRKVYPAPQAPRRRGRPAGPPGIGGPPGTPSGGANGAAPRGEIVALHGLDLEVRDGEFFGLLGPNGAGKTTTIGILTTRVKPTSGTALVGGADVNHQAVQVRQRIVGFDEGHKADGSRCCLILLDPGLIAVRPLSRRAFQGWRYFDAADAPPDLKRGNKALAELPPKMRRDLADLGLL